MPETHKNGSAPEFCWAGPWHEPRVRLVKRINEYRMDCPECGAEYAGDGSWFDGTGRTA